MVKVKDVLAVLEKTAPLSYKMDFDNVGLLVGNGDRAVTKVVLALDASCNVIQEAVKEGAELIVAHHPLFFQLKSVTDDSYAGRNVISLIENKISVICMHTNMDVALGGVNDALADAVGIKSPKVLEVSGVAGDGEYGLGRYGELEESISLEDFLKKVKLQLGCEGLRYADASQRVRKVAVVGGSGGDCVAAALRAGCDTLLTADVKHHQFMEAAAMGLNIIDGGHFSTENVVIPVFKEMISKAFPELKVWTASSNCSPEKYYN